MQKKTNEQFMILSVIGILIVVICHLARDIYKYLEFLPYIAIFVFVSGYFYKEKNEEKPLKHIWYKFKKLMIPFLIINLIYGIIVTILKEKGVIYFGQGINLFTLFVEPFINNNQFVFNFPAWFVPTLFLTYLVFFLIHILSRKIIKSDAKREIIVFIIFIVLQITSTFLQGIIVQNEYFLIILRVMFFIPFLEFGHIYKERLQKYDDKIPTVPYLIILMGFNFIMYKIFGDLNYDMHEFSGFKGIEFLLPTVTSFIGILVYTRIARILSKKLGKNNVVNYISNNTFSIMTHHIFISFIIGLLLYTLGVPYFNVELFKTGWIYVYNIPNMQIVIQIIYIMAGVFGSLFIHWLYEKGYSLQRKSKGKGKIK